MANATTVTLVNGVPTGPSGTVSTIDALMADGGQATLGAKADAASTSTDTTAVSHTSILKQISKSIQAAATSLAGTLTVATHAVTQSGSWVLSAGSALIGKVGIDQTTPGTTDSVSVKRQGTAASATFTCGTTAYATGDAVGSGAAAAALTFASFAPAACEMLITSATLEIDAAALISGETSYALELFNVTPPSALTDSAAWTLPSGDRASHLGTIQLGTPSVKGATVKVDSDAINKQITTLGTSVFAYLICNGAYTPTARAFTVKLHGIPI